MAVSRQERRERPSVISFERQFSQKEVEEKAQRLIKAFKRDIVRKKGTQRFRRSIELGDHGYYIHFIDFGDNQQLVAQSLLGGIIEESLFVQLRRQKLGEPGVIHYYHWRGGRVESPHLENSTLAVQKAEELLVRLGTLLRPKVATL